MGIKKKLTDYDITPQTVVVGVYLSGNGVVDKVVFYKIKTQSV